MKSLSFLGFCLFAVSVMAQDNNLPKDLLNEAFHRERRSKLREALPENSVAVFFANPVRNRSNDVD